MTFVIVFVSDARPGKSLVSEDCTGDSPGKALETARHKQLYSTQDDV